MKNDCMTFEDGAESALEISTPVAVAAPADKVTALNVRMAELTIPGGTPAERANALHREFIQSAMSAKVRAVQCGWVLAAQRECVGYGQWNRWVNSLDFSKSTAYNYIKAFESTVGVWRAQQRRPLPLTVEPTMEEILAATAGAKEKPLAKLYRDTGVVENDPKWGGAREGAGRTPGALPKLTATQEAETLWAQVMGVLDKTTVKDAIRFLGEKAAEACLDRVAELAEALKLQVRELRGVR